MYEWSLQLTLTPIWVGKNNTLKSVWEWGMIVSLAGVTVKTGGFTVLDTVTVTSQATKPWLSSFRLIPWPPSPTQTLMKRSTFLSFSYNTWGSPYKIEMHKLCFSNRERLELGDHYYLIFPYVRVFVSLYLVNTKILLKKYYSASKCYFWFALVPKVNEK